jgi:hypothetical protein
MSRFNGLLVASFVIVLLWSSSSFAVGLGAFVDGAVGSGSAEWDGGSSSFDIDARTFAVGFALDTATTNERLFNYRLNLGYVRHEFEDESNTTIKTSGVYAENIFGFALVRNENFRWWAGPLLRVGYLSGETGTDGTDFEFVEFGVGAVTGLNFKTGNTILSPSIGVRFNGYGGEGTGGGADRDISQSTTNVFVNFAVLF